MNQRKIDHILCAVRGARESRNTISRAIDLALEHDARLTFIHALDAEFLNHATVGPLSVVYKELKEMGEFSMMVVRDRAERRGVTQVTSIVREGNIRKQLREMVQETQADMIVMGRPVRSPGSNVFRPGELETFASELAKGTDAELVIVGD